jgi:hypothetical protein
MKPGCERQHIELVERGVVLSADNMNHASPFAADESQRLLPDVDEDPEE